MTSLARFLFLATLLPAPAAASEENSFRGSTTQSGAALEGILYDNNIIAVAVNQQLVLFEEGVSPGAPKTNWTPPSLQQLPTYQNRGFMQNGKWFTLRSGEADGGASAFFLMIEKQGETYPKNSKGDPILPIFQVAPYDTPHITASQLNDYGPDFSPGKPWISVQ
jgi:hypothetical protein